MKKGDSVYIAGPYTNGNVSENIRTAVEVGEEVANLGLSPFVPHLYHLWDFISPHNYEYWMSLCLGWVPKCQAVYRIFGKSTGADMECKLAETLGIPVVHTIHQLRLLLEKGKKRK